MKVTRASVKEHAEFLGLEPIQIDGVPEGFSFKEPDIKIGQVEVKGKIIKFKPMADWSDKDAITHE